MASSETPSRTSGVGAAREALEASLGELVRRSLAEDVGAGDWTTRWTVPSGDSCRARVVAREELVVAGTAAFRAVFAELDPGVEVVVESPDGTRVSAGTTLLLLRGPTRAVLTGERTALNFLGRLSGIATLTRRFVDAVDGTGVRIVDTRKTTPGWRLLEKAAVRAGGGTNHRMGLWDMVLVKENHVAAAGGLEAALARVREENGRGLPVEVEVRDLEELETALSLDVDRILLDNLSPPVLAEAVSRARERGGSVPELEASGNVTLSTVRAVASTGVDLVSVGALTHSAPAADLTLLVEG